MKTEKTNKNKERTMLNPIRNDDFETDLLDDLIEELKSLQALNHKGYDFHITTYHLETGDVEGLQNALTHLNSSKPSHTRVKLICVRTS